MSVSYLRRRPQSTKGWWGLSKVTPGNIFVPRLATAHVSFEDPSNPLSEEFPQQWRIRVRRGTFGLDSTNPTIRVDLLEGGNLVETPIPDTVVDSSDSIVLEGTWEAVVLPSRDGSEVEALLTSTNTKGETHVEIASLQWQPVLSEGIGAPLTAKWHTKKKVAGSLNLRWDTQVTTTGPYGLDGTDIYFNSPNSWLTVVGDDVVFSTGAPITIEGEDLVIHDNG